jgi:MFS family permease
VPLPIPKKKLKIQWSNLANLGTIFWGLMLVNGVFMLSRMGETFLTLHAHSNLNLATKYVPIIMMLFNVGWCVSSYPVGVLADRMNRYLFLGIGIIFLVLADIILASSLTLPVFYVGVLLWGIQYGITQNIFTSLIAETVSEKLRGTAFGIYYIISAVAVSFADTSAGLISKNFGEAKAFLTSGVVGLISLLILLIVMTRKRSSQASI